jgi:tyrosinase
MKFATCAQVLSAAVIASSASVPIDGKRSVQHSSSQGTKIKAISWDEAVQIMGEDTSGSDAKVSSLSNTNASQPGPSCTDKVRVEWNNLADADKLSFVQSVKCLMKATPLGVWANATSIWDEITWVHDQLSDRIHGVDSFLPWHRYYLHMFQTLLKEQCAYTGPMPWWRETKYTGNFAGSGLFTPEYFGALPPLSNTGEGTCITDGVSNTTISSSFLQDFQVTTTISNTL